MYSEEVHVSLKRKYKVLDKPLYIRTDLFGERIYFRVPKGFKTDFASIPRVFWSFISPSDGDILVPSIAHDYLYSKKSITFYVMKDKKLYNKGRLDFSRLEADNLLKEKMKSFKASFIKRNLVFLAVRLFGWIYWYKLNKILCKKK